MKIIIKNSSMEFQKHNAFPIQTETIDNGQWNTWFPLLVPAESGQTYRVRIVSVEGATWNTADAIIGFAPNGSTYSDKQNRAIISKLDVGRYFDITLTDNFNYLYVYLPEDIHLATVVVESQRIS